MALQRYKDLSHLIEYPELGTSAPSHLAFVDLMYSGGVMFHEVQQGEEGRLDLISWLYFKDTRFWEIIGWYNNIRDPLREPSLGAIIQIPVDPISITKDIKAFTYLEL